jgi:GNAT superfamily N-acetyltransferase
MLQTMECTIRPGHRDDLPEVLRLIKALAVYEKAGELVHVTLEQLTADYTREPSAFGLIVAEGNAGLLGMAFYFIRYSTWRGRLLYLEDLVVDETVRGQGVGAALFEATVHRGLALEAQGMCWQVLDWNTPAIAFYEKYDAEISTGWLNGGLSLNQMRRIASP